MDNLIDNVIEKVQEVKDKGGQVDTDKLLELLANTKKNLPTTHDFNLEKLKAGNTHNLERMKLIGSINLENYRSVIAAGTNASKACMLLNGGAAVALLAFMGNIWNKENQIAAVSQISYGILSFCAGVLLAVLCMGSIYLSQFAYGLVDIESERPEKSKAHIAGRIFNVTAMFAWVASIALFAIGCYCAFNAMGSQFSPG
ncbi:hypothetical protein NJH77_25965 [Serratia fonticola]|uniref:hypothetical protein n=1 Tax=Serratia fonticola TaxID=47917 RepID=UPI00209744BA|nr:hypothetical protein [Serratia fonticola]MCO7512692.1 hypothetical protein [Serratia fonticola]